MKLMMATGLASAIATFAPLTSSAANYIGTVNMLEVWSNGNIAFTLQPAIPSCNAQVILNKSSDGTKNLYALVLSAKRTGVSIVVSSDTCGPAEGFGGNYNLPAYIYSYE